MRTADQNAIKRDNIGNIFDALRHGERTRSELSAVTGLSLMTIGKTVDLLTDAGLTTQQKIRAASAGRSSLSCRIADRAMLVYDLSDGMSVSSVDILTNIKSKYSTDRENFALTAAEAFFDASKDGDLIGRGLILPDKAPDEAARLFAALEPNRPDTTLTRTKAAALAACSDEPIGVFISVSDTLDVISGAVTADSQLLGGLFAKTDFARLGAPESVIDAAEALLSPAVIRVWSPPEAAEKLRGRLTSPAKLEFLTDPDLPIRGAAKLLISKRLDALSRLP